MAHEISHFIQRDLYLVFVLENKSILEHVSRVCTQQNDGYERDLKSRKVKPLQRFEHAIFFAVKVHPFMIILDG